MFKVVLRMLHWKWIGLPALFVLAACGGQSRMVWPAAVAEISIAGEGKNSIVAGIEDLNKGVGDNILKLETGTGSPIYIKSVSSFGAVSALASQGTQVHLAYVELGLPNPTGRSRAAAPKTQVAGRATVESGKCTIELGSFLFEASASDLLLPVLWHELGHCGGLGHVEENDELMSKITNRWASYTPEKLSRFFDALLASIR